MTWIAREFSDSQWLSWEEPGTINNKELTFWPTSQNCKITCHWYSKKSLYLPSNWTFA